MKPSFIGLAAAPTLLAATLPAQAFDLNDQLSIGGVLAATGQCQSISARLPAEDYDDSGLLDAFDDECRGAMPFQLEVSLRPDEANEFFLLLGFAVDNGLNTVSPWALAPWAADLEDDVKDINGRGRDYLLAAWYKHTFTFAQDHTLGATFGILDSTAYLDANEYANDEYTQFMNEAFVNSGSYGLPSYDAGAALEWARGDWSFNAMGMNVGANDDGNDFNFWGLQLGYHPQTAMGAGNYRLVLTGAGEDFLNPTGDKVERRLGWGISFDQELTPNLGAFLRFSWQEEDAAVDYAALYSAGINLTGGAWGRESDTLGLGYAYLDGGNLDIESTQVFEGYYRFVINDYLALTADVQYMSDDRVQADPTQEDPEGWIVGMRLTAGF